MANDNMAQIASYWNMKFKDAMVSKSPYTKEWKEYMDAYFGDYFKNESVPDYKSNMVSNYIFSIIETIRPIMLDNDPKFQVVPRQPEGMPFSNDLQEALSYEWDREDMQVKLHQQLIYTLALGTSVFFLPWDANEKNVKGIPVNPFNIFPDPLATSVEDAEYIIYASYKNQEVLRRNFPKFDKELTGGDIQYGELVNDNNVNAKIDNQILTLEIYTKDYESEEYIDEEKNVSVKKQKYPNGRVFTICPELSLVLSDKKVPYKSKCFPFVLVKNYDVPGKFWGVGEIKQLLSPQKYVNELNNSILDNAKATANMPWIIDKNSGIPQGGIKNRPGLVIRKNPGTEVRRDQPPSMPNYVMNAVETYKSDMEQISGIFDSIKGNAATGVYTAQGILALQEAGQARIRLKVKQLESSLGKLAVQWFSRMKQFWTQERWLGITRFDGTYDIKKFRNDSLNFDYDFRITAGSTMPVNRGAMLDLMIRLAQTPMPDGQMLVDREAVATYLPEEVKSAMIRRMGGQNQQLEQLQQALQQMQQQFQQLVKENSSNDQQTMQIVEQMTTAIEALKKQILQLNSEHDKMVEEKQQQDKINQVKDQSYNEGYKDAETLHTTDTSNNSTSSSNSSSNSVDSGNSDHAGLGLPNDLLHGLNNMTNDELQVLLDSNPELQDLIK